MKRCFFYGLFFGLMALVAGSCDTDTEPIDPEPEYLPMKAGFFIVYEVDSIGYTSVGSSVESSFQLKSVVVDSFLNAQNTYTYVMHRFRRATQLHSWAYLDTWSARWDGRRAMVAEGSTEFIKFIIPPTTGQTWDGNLFNGEGKDEYEMASQGNPCQVGALNFDDCLVVVQNEEDDGVVFADERQEVYALNVGLVNREVKQFTYCTAGCPTIGLIESGFEYSQRIIDYGFE